MIDPVARQPQHTPFIDLVYGTLSLYGRRLRFLGPLAGVIWGAAFLLQLVIALVLGVPGRIQAVQGPAPQVSSASAGILGVYMVAVVLTGLAAVVFSQAALVTGAVDEQLSGKAGIRAALAHARSVLWPVTGVFLVLVVLILVADVAAIVILLAVLFVLGLLGGGGQLTVIALMFLVASVLPLLVFARFVLAVPIAVVEGLAPMAAMRAAFDAIRGRYLRVLLLVLVVSFLGWLITAVFDLLFGQTASWGPMAQLVASDIAGTLLATLFAPLPAAMFAAVYAGLRGTQVTAAAEPASVRLGAPL